jgi:hypothetical protein
MTQQKVGDEKLERKRLKICEENLLVLKVAKARFEVKTFYQKYITPLQ